MKDCSKAELEAARPKISRQQAINHCLCRLYADKKHSIRDELCTNLTYEELIGALLLARDQFEASIS